MICSVFFWSILAYQVRGYPGAANTTTETIDRNSSSLDTGPGPSPQKIPGKIYSDIIKISDKEHEKISLSEEAKDSKPSHTNQPESKIFILDNGKRYELGQQPFRYSDPYLSAAIGAVSAHLINHARQEYVPYPPNGNPQDYPPYRGQEYAESPLAGAYERANRAGYGYFHARQERPNFASYPEHRPNSCYPNFYSGDAERGEFEEVSYGGRGRQEPIKRHLHPRFTRE